MTANLLSHLWCSLHPAEANRLFDVYGELTGREAGWLDRLPLLQPFLPIRLRQRGMLPIFVFHIFRS